LRRIEDLRGERREVTEGGRTIIREPDRTIIVEGGRTISCGGGPGRVRGTELPVASPNNKPNQRPE
jgi:hypothetical protein